MTDPCVMATVRIDARPEVVYRPMTDLPTLASLAEDAVAMEWRNRRPRWFRKVAGKATVVSDRAAANTEHMRLTLQRLKQRSEIE